MKKLHFSISINAPVEKVWETMLEPETYQQWTKAFDGSSRYEGNWEQGSEMRFLGTGENGEVMGMYSRIKENRLHEFISIEHLGQIKDGQVDTDSPEVAAWAGVMENYTFHDHGDHTEVEVDLDTVEEYADMFNDMWPKALQLLKELAEK